MHLNNTFFSSPLNILVAS